jgi:hypothetical protein
MYFGQPSRSAAFHPAVAPVRPAMPAPRVITREIVRQAPPRTVFTPGPVRTVYRPGETRYVPGATVTRNYYNTVVRPDRGAIERARVAQSRWDRDHFRLERLASRDANAAAQLAALQQQLYQAQVAAQQPPTVQPQVQPQGPVAVQNMPQPTPNVSPASPAVDLTPHQDAADGGGGGGDDGGGGGGGGDDGGAAAADGGGGGGGGGGHGHGHGDDGGPAGHKPHHLLLFVGLIGVAGVGGYMLMRKKKPSTKKPD